MRTPAPVAPPVGLTIAGSDSGGGAGIQADLAAMTAAGVFGTSVVTAVTAQNTQGVSDTHVLPSEDVAEQCRAVLSDFDVQAAKTGMLATAPIIETVTEVVADRSIPLVVDPVMVAESGDRLLDRDAESAYTDLIAAATLVTPNVDEAEALTDQSIETPDDAVVAGEALLEMGVDAALVKGGHLAGETVVDVLVTEETTERFEHPRIDADAGHGSGCTLSAHIAARLARGEPLIDAVAAGTDFMERAVRYHYAVGTGGGPVNPSVDLQNRAHRAATADGVRDVVTRLEAADARLLVPQVGLNVAGATPHAEASEDVAAVEGRVTRRHDGIGANGEVRFGVSNHAARVLLGLREDDPSVRFLAACRLDTDVEAAVDALGWTTSRTGDRDTIVANARLAMERADGTPEAIFYDGGPNLEPVCFVTGPAADRLGERLLELLAELR